MRRFIILVFLLSSQISFAAVQLGLGLSSSMSGRMVPGIELGLGSEKWLGTINAVGVKSGYYYHSNYSASFFRTWEAGSLFWGDMRSGVGGGLMFAQRGFQDENSTVNRKKSDFAAGPAYFLQWHFAGPIYLKLDMIWGLRGLSQMIGLNGQDVVFLSIGGRAW